MPKERTNRPEVDSLLPDVDEEMRGEDAERDEARSSSEDDMSTSRHDDKPTSRQADMSTSRHADMSTLAEKLDVLMDGPDTPYASEVPDLPARSNGYLSADVEEALQQATSVLKNRYSTISKSLIMNYAIRVVLWDLRQNADESELIRWLDEVIEAVPEE